MFFFLVRDTEDDDVAVERNHAELTKELRRDKPRKEIVLSLARQTFQTRRSSVLTEAADVPVTSLLVNFPELCNHYVVCALRKHPVTWRNIVAQF